MRKKTLEKGHKEGTEYIYLDVKQQPLYNENNKMLLQCGVKSIATCDTWQQCDLE